MQDYREYTPEKLATDASFRRWILEAKHNDTIFWENWLLQNPDRKDLVEEGMKMLLSIRAAYENVSEAEVKQGVKRVAEAIETLAAQQQQIRPFWQTWAFRVAASIAVVLGSTWWYMQQSTTADLTAQLSYQETVAMVKEPMIEKVNQSEKPMLITLADGSSIMLQKNSRISYQAAFKANKREVYLAGEAFFEIAKNPFKPFYVYANNLTTRVLGTSFLIQAYQNDTKVKVIVKTGRVSVFAGTQKDLVKNYASTNVDGLVLTPNQQVVFSRTDNRLIRSLIDTPQVLDLPMEQQQFNFEHAPIQEVFSTIEKFYGVKIMFDAEVMKSCYLTANLEDEPLFEKLNLICRTLDARYEQIDAQIIISSNGCL